VRLKSLTVHELANGLTVQLSLLGGARSASRRQRTLRNTVEWSHQLCTPDEQRVWARASVFPGSFDLPTAEQVCSGEQIAPEAVLDLIDGLVDKSVLITEQHADQHRYRMLEALREYGREQLSDEEADRVRRRLRDYYARLAARLYEVRTTPDDLPLSRRLRRDHSNLRAALEFCLTTPGEAAAGLALAADLNHYWGMWRLRAEARTWLDRLLPRSPPDTPSLGVALNWNANYSLIEGDLTRCAELLAQAQDIAQRTGDSLLSNRNKATAALLAEARGELAHATQRFAALIVGQRAAGDRPGELFSLYHWGLCTAFAGDPDRGREILQEGLARCADYGATWVQLNLLCALARIEAEYGDPAAADGALRTMLGVVDDDTKGQLDGEDVTTIAWVAGRMGDHTRAATLYGVIEALCRRDGFDLQAYGLIAAPNQRHVQQTRDVLGEDEFERRFAAGAANVPIR
jgi:non-specific serine/threonine protein kinase